MHSLSGDEIAEELREVRKERDELLAALRNMVSMFSGSNWEPDDRLIRAEELLARIEGKG